MNILITLYFSFLSLFLSFSTNSQKVEFKTTIETITTLSDIHSPAVQHLVSVVTFDKKAIKSQGGVLTVNFEVSEADSNNIVFDQSLTIKQNQSKITKGEINDGKIVIINDSLKDQIQARFVRKIQAGKTYTIKANELNQHWTGSSTLTSANQML